MSDEKKIIIDEDWKSQVEAEKEELERGRQAKAAEGTDAPAEAAAVSEDAAASEDAAMPPASFEVLLSMLATEAAISMGQLPHPTTGQPEKNLDQARYLVDTIEMLEEKTRGNLTDEESAGITDLLHQLRMLFISVQ